jgi:hypothetical protein
MPRRIQLRRTKGWRIPANTVVVARPSKWGNPFHISKAAEKEYANGDPFLQMMDAQHGVVTTSDAAVHYFRRYLRTATGRQLCRQAKTELRGKNLACWCKPGAPCHADVLLEVANR